jgi:hypothetical protein
MTNLTKIPRGLTTSEWACNYEASWQGDIVQELCRRSGQYDEYDWRRVVELRAAQEIERLRKALKEKETEIRGLLAPPPGAQIGIVTMRDHARGMDLALCVREVTRHRDPIGCEVLYVVVDMPAAVRADS